MSPCRNSPRFSAISATPSAPITIRRAITFLVRLIRLGCPSRDRCSVYPGRQRPCRPTCTSRCSWISGTTLVKVGLYHDKRDRWFGYGYGRRSNVPVFGTCCQLPTSISVPRTEAGNQYWIVATSDDAKVRISPVSIERPIWPSSRATKPPAGGSRSLQTLRPQPPSGRSHRLE